MILAPLDVRRALRSRLRRSRYSDLRSADVRIIRSVKRILRDAFSSEQHIPIVISISSLEKTCECKTVGKKCFIIHDTAYTTFLLDLLEQIIKPRPPIYSFVPFMLLATEHALLRNQQALALDIAELSHLKVYHYDQMLEALPDGAAYYNPVPATCWFMMERYDMVASPFHAYLIGHEAGHCFADAPAALGFRVPFRDIQSALIEYAGGYDYTIEYDVGRRSSGVARIGSVFGGSSGVELLFNEDELRSDFVGFLIAARESRDRGVPAETFLSHFQEIFYLFQTLQTVADITGSICDASDPYGGEVKVRISYPIYGLRFLSLVQAISISVDNQPRLLKEFLGEDLECLQALRKPPEQLEPWRQILGLSFATRWALAGFVAPEMLCEEDLGTLMPEPFPRPILSPHNLLRYFDRAPGKMKDPLLIGFVQAIRHLCLLVHSSNARGKLLGSYRRAAKGKSDRELLALVQRPMDDRYQSVRYPLAGC